MNKTTLKEKANELNIPRRNLMSMEEHETRNEVQKNIVIDGGNMKIDIRTGEGFRPWS